MVITGPKPRLPGSSRGLCGALLAGLACYHHDRESPGETGSADCRLALNHCDTLKEQPGFSYNCPALNIGLGLKPYPVKVTLSKTDRGGRPGTRPGGSSERRGPLSQLSSPQALTKKNGLGIRACGRSRLGGRVGYLAWVGYYMGVGAFVGEGVLCWYGLGIRIYLPFTGEGGIG